MTPCFDAHNHLHDSRLAPFLDDIIATMREVGIARCVVNGTCEEDWPQVAALARRFPDLIVPSFGLHPWKAGSRSPRWQETLTEHLDAFPGSGIGECGLDRWIPDHDLEDQTAVFLAQLELAATRNLALSVHCLKAWGPLLDCLRNHALPQRGFLLHSYGGSRELITEFAPLGAWFSFSGHFLTPRKAAVREAFRHAPLEHILVETDAPDMALPESHRKFALVDADDKPLNHPANLPAIAAALGALLDLAPDPARERFATNFQNFFGS